MNDIAKHARMPLRTARDVDLTDRVSDCTGLGCVSARGPFHSKGSTIRQLRGSAESPVSSGMVCATASRTKGWSPVAIHHSVCRLGVVLASNSSNSSNRESADTSCMLCLPCSSCSISCSLDRGSPRNSMGPSSRRPQERALEWLS